MAHDAFTSTLWMGFSSRILAWDPVIFGNFAADRWNAKLSVHLMIKRPERYLEMFRLVVK